MRLIICLVLLCCLVGCSATAPQSKDAKYDGIIAVESAFAVLSSEGKDDSYDPENDTPIDPNLRDVPPPPAENETSIDQSVVLVGHVDYGKWLLQTQPNQDCITLPNGQRVCQPKRSLGPQYTPALPSRTDGKPLYDGNLSHSDEIIIIQSPPVFSEPSYARVYATKRQARVTRRRTHGGLIRRLFSRRR